MNLHAWEGVLDIENLSKMTLQLRWKASGSVVAVIHPNSRTRWVVEENVEHYVTEGDAVLRTCSSAVGETVLVSVTNDDALRLAHSNTPVAAARRAISQCASGLLKWRTVLEAFLALVMVLLVWFLCRRRHNQCNWEDDKNASQSERERESERGGRSPRPTTTRTKRHQRLPPNSALTTPAALASQLQQVSLPPPEISTGASSTWRPPDDYEGAPSFLDESREARSFVL